MGVGKGAMHWVERLSSGSFERVQEVVGVVTMQVGAEPTTIERYYAPLLRVRRRDGCWGC